MQCKWAVCQVEKRCAHSSLVEEQCPDSELVFFAEAAGVDFFCDDGHWTAN